MEPIYRDTPLRPLPKRPLPKLSSIPSPEDDEELCLVMQEISDALGAVSIVLTVQDNDGDHTKILRVSNRFFDNQIIHRLHSADAFYYNEATVDDHYWKTIKIDAQDVDVMVLPVRRTVGHRRMVVAALFQNATNETRANADKIYLRRRPFAVGYFRLWQVDRARERREKALEGALNSIGTGVVLVDADSNTAFANLEARDLLASGSGIRLDGDRLHTTNLKDGIRLRAALDHVILSNSLRSPMFSISRGSKPPLLLIVRSFEYGIPEAGASAAIVYIVDPATSVTELVEPLCRSYQMSISETKLACLLVTGVSLSECAVLMSIKEMTARGMLKSIFRKTDTSRQGELISRLLFNVTKLRKPIQLELI